MNRVVLSSNTTRKRNTSNNHSLRFYLPGPAVRRMLAEPNLQHAFNQIHACGPRSVAMFVAELIDATNSDARALDRVFTWRAGIAPEMIAAIAGEWPPTSLHEVEKRRCREACR